MTRGIPRPATGPLSLALAAALLVGCVPMVVGTAVVGGAIVAKLDSVQSVVNELSVGPATTFRERSNDAYITTKVKASIVDSQDLFANSIKIVTHRGVVYLMGRVTEREANHAAELARGVSGVVKVVKVFEIISEADLARMQVKTTAKPASAPASAP